MRIIKHALVNSFMRKKSTCRKWAEKIGWGETQIEVPGWGHAGKNITVRSLPNRKKGGERSRTSEKKNVKRERSGEDLPSGCNRLNAVCGREPRKFKNFSAETGGFTHRAPSSMGLDIWTQLVQTVVSEGGTTFLRNVNSTQTRFHCRHKGVGGASHRTAGKILRVSLGNRQSRRKGKGDR